ncbi:Asp23/Gls24 family envelope stress response protein [Collinsella sp. An2]|uniref:Asp23/Gls24 family envelope stress response protein n=1 Tax=Collinsella sp. An2 TaxID=1965585 RepID=UPI000B36B5FC|nr:Asp23/Gls24 family envelope stress response protein [Collinsella sp. An2]
MTSMDTEAKRDEAVEEQEAVAAATTEQATEAEPASAEEAEAAGAADGDAEGAKDEEAAEASDADEDEDEDDYDDTEDSLTYSNGVIEKIVAMATREVPHVLGMKGNLMHFVQEQFGAENLTKGVSVEVTDDNRVIVNISVIIEYGCYAPAIFEDVKERVTQRLVEMTGLEVAGINLRIEDVVTREEYEASRKKFIDSLKHEEAQKAE